MSDAPEDSPKKQGKLRNILYFLSFFLVFLGNLALFPLAAQFFQEQKLSASGQIQVLENQIVALKQQLDSVEDSMSREAGALKDLEVSTLTGLQRIHELHFELMKKNDGTPGLWKTPGKIAYLTFDDGPSDVTPLVLDTLKKENVKATFFVNGRSSKRDLYRRIVSEGHVLGNHTWSHEYTEIYASVENFLRDVDKLDQYIESLGLRPAKIYRFPGGATNNVALKSGGTVHTARISQAMAERKYTFYEWNVTGEEGESAQDRYTREEIAQQVLKMAEGKKIAIVLLHDGPGRMASAQALEKIIPGLRAQGFSFSSLPQR